MHDLETYNWRRTDQAILVSILRDLRSLAGAELTLIFEQYTNVNSPAVLARLNPDIARDVLHAAVYAGSRITSMTMMDIHRIDPASIGHAGFLELYESTRCVQHLEIHLGLDDLIPNPGMPP